MHIHVYSFKIHDCVVKKKKYMVTELFMQIESLLKIAGADIAELLKGLLLIIPDLNILNHPSSPIHFLLKTLCNIESVAQIKFIEIVHYQTKKPSIIVIFVSEINFSLRYGNLCPVM